MGRDWRMKTLPVDQTALATPRTSDHERQPALQCEYEAPPCLDCKLYRACAHLRQACRMYARWLSNNLGRSRRSRIRPDPDRYPPSRAIFEQCDPGEDPDRKGPARQPLLEAQRRTAQAKRDAGQSLELIAWGLGVDRTRLKREMGW